MKDDGGAYFRGLPRWRQRRNLLRRLMRVRARIEQYLRDMAFWNELQRSRGGETVPEDFEMVAALADIDQRIAQMSADRARG